MRNKVISFLKNSGNNPEQDFNEALILFMRSETANRSLVRSYNVQGFSEQRLKELLYDLRQAYHIEASEVVKEAETTVKELATGNMVNVPEAMPEFSKGTKGNSERRAYLKDHDIASESFKNEDMDAAIMVHLNKKMAERASIEADKIKEAVIENLKVENKKQGFISPEFFEKARHELVMTEDEFFSFVKENDKKIYPVSLNDTGSLDNKLTVDGVLKELAEKNFKKEDLTETYLAELQTGLDLNDASFQAFLKQVEAATNAIDAAADKVSKIDTNIPKNDTDVQDSEPADSENEKK